MLSLSAFAVQVAYVPQSAFIYNASVRDNILFGLPFDQERYDQAIAAAAVRPDLDNMPGKIFIALKKHHACMHACTLKLRLACCQLYVVLGSLHVQNGRSVLGSCTVQHMFTKQDPQ